MRRLIALATLCLLPASTFAAVVSYRFEVSGDRNLPYFSWYNTSSEPVAISSVRVTIGDVSKNFDNALYEGLRKPGTTTWLSQTTGFTQFGPDNNGTGGTRADYVQYNLSAGLAKGAAWRWRSDIDQDKAPPDATLDYRYILFDLGGTSSTDNALLTVRFANGKVLSKRLPDFALSSTGTYRVDQSLTYTLSVAPASFSATGAVPEPAVGLLAVAGIVVLGRRR